MATIQPLQDIMIACYVPYPTLVVSVTMASLHMESSSSRRASTAQPPPATPPRETKVIIVNVAGTMTACYIDIVHKWFRSV